MAKQKNKPAAADKASLAEHLMRKGLIHAVIACVLAGVCTWGMVRLRQHVDTQAARPTAAPAVTLKHRPAWMSEKLAEQIVNAVRPLKPVSAFDRGVLEEMGKSLQRNAWVRQVKLVRRAYGQAPGDTIEIDCEWRSPVALVHVAGQGGGEYMLVDGEGVLLPMQYAATQIQRVMFSGGLVELRVIDGVAAAPPRLPGDRWAGEDLRAGLDLVKFLYGRDVVEDIHRVDVSNFAGRKNPREAQLVLVTARNTRILWGKPVTASFPEVSPSEKLDRLARIKRQFQGRIDAGQPWVDVRFDKVLVPAQDEPIVQAIANE